MKDGTESKLKFTELMRRLDLPRWQARGLLDTLWQFTTHNAPTGNVGRFTDDQIALGIDWRGNAGELVSALVDLGWLDRDERCRLVVHDWYEHCEDSVHRRLAQAVEYFHDGRRPRLTRFSKPERAAIEAQYREKEASQRSYAAQHIYSQKCTEKHAPSPAKPDPAKPEPSQAPASVAPLAAELPEADPPRPPRGRTEQEAAAGASRSQESRGAPPPTAAPPPRTDGRSVFARLTPAVLRDTGQLVAWWHDASRRRKPVISSSEQSRLYVLAAAERALEVGTAPVALFAWLVSGGHWTALSDAQRERARRRLRDHDRDNRRLMAPRAELAAIGRAPPAEPSTEDRRADFLRGLQALAAGA